TRQQIAALAGFGVLQRGERVAELGAEFHGRAHVLVARALLVGDPKCANHRDQEQKQAEAEGRRIRRRGRKLPAQNRYRHEASAARMATLISEKSGSRNVLHSRWRIRSTRRSPHQVWRK